MSWQPIQVTHQNNEVKILSPPAVKSLLSSKVVEELLSKSGAIGQEAAKTIADAAMLEVASTNVPHMVKKQPNTAKKLPNRSSSETDCPFSSQAPDDFYEGITFEHFEQV